MYPILLVLLIFAGCQSEGANAPSDGGCRNCGQGDTDSSQDSGAMDDGDGAVDSGGDQLDGPDTGRTLVVGTDGFCTIDVPLANTCLESTDCVSYRVPVKVDCSSGTIDEPDCVVGNQDPSNPPRSDGCGADYHCDIYPRECRGGECVFIEPLITCTAIADCKMTQTPCGCVAVNVAEIVDGYVFGDKCPDNLLCSESTLACIDNKCVLIGSYMDPAIDDYCNKQFECRFSDVTVADCIGLLKANSYRDALKIWSIIVSAGVASSCEGLSDGPWKHAIACGL